MGELYSSNQLDLHRPGTQTVSQFTFCAASLRNRHSECWRHLNTKLGYAAIHDCTSNVQRLESYGSANAIHRTKMSESTMPNKSSLFSRLRKDWDTHGGELLPKNTLLCPLCWQQCSLLDLSVEHVVPKSVGGHCVTLTCRSCNNRHGSLYDRQLAYFQQAADAVRGYGELPVDVFFTEELRVGAALRIDGDAFRTLSIQPRRTNPHCIQTLRGHAEASTLPSDEVKISLQKMPVENSFRAALVRAAYLTCFHQFGYRYAVSDAAATVRKALEIVETQPRIVRLLAGLRTTSDSGSENARSTLLHTVQLTSVAEAEETTETVIAKAFLVRLRLKTNTSSTHFILLPSPPDSSEQLLTLLELIAQQGRMRVHFELGNGVSACGE